jgi:hypothetical protein
VNVITAPSPAPVASAPAASPARGPLLRSVRGELIKLTRRRVVIGTAAAVAVIAVGGTAIGIAAAEPAASTVRQPDRAISIPALEQAGGGTALFAQTAGFMSAFLTAVLVATVASEFTRGTFRTMLLQQPRRARLLAGKVAALVAFMAVAAAVAEALGWVTSRVMAPGQGIDPAAWTTMDALVAGLEDFGRAALFLTGMAAFATMVGVLARSVPIGVGAALVWLGPIENIIGDSWDPGPRWFPGLLLRAVISPGSTGVSTGRALATLAVYAIVAVVVTVAALGRRDVTS